MSDNNKNWRAFNSCFHFICLCGTISVVCYCFYQYTLDEDVSLIDFKIFHDNMDALYPTTTLCFYNPFLEHDLRKFGNGINTTSYSQYLQGHLDDERMKNIDYDHVTVSLEEKLLQASGKMENGTLLWLYDKENKHPPHVDSHGRPMYYVSFRSGVQKCFSFNIPYIENNFIWSLFVKMKLDTFPRDVRDSELKFDGSNSTRGGFSVSFHYPFQRFHSRGARKYQWKAFKRDERGERNCRGFYMQFRIKGVEVLARRNKASVPCNGDWQSDDLILENNIIRSLRCLPPHMSNWTHLSNWTLVKKFAKQPNIAKHLFKDWEIVKSFPTCASPRDIKHILDPTNDELEMYSKPCRIIEKLGFDYDEGFQFPPMEKDICQKTDNSWFSLRVYFDETTFKEIKQVRALNLEGLFGNISGYIGFILGYSVLQLPNLFLLIKNIGQIYWTYYKHDGKPQQDQEEESQTSRIQGIGYGRQRKSGRM